MVDYSKIIEGFFTSGKYSKAIEFSEKFIEQGNQDSRTFQIIGMSYYRLKDYKKSIEFLQKSIDIDPTNADVLYNLGLAYIYARDYKQAENYTEKALAIDKNSFDYLYQLAFIFDSTNREEKALEICAQILDQEPTDQSTLKLRSRINLTLKRYKECIADFEKIKLNDNNKSFYFNNLGWCYLKLENYTKAKTYLQMALEIEPGHGYANNNLGFVYFKEKNYSKALQYINESIDIDSSNSYAFKNRALVYLALNENNKAKEDLQLALELGYAELFDSEVSDLLEQISD